MSGKSPAEKEVWYAEGVRFQCQRCGQCCRGEPGYVWVKQGEIARMAAHLGMEREEFARRFVRREGFRLSLKERDNGDCVLWQDKCTVYEVRPAQCRNFPFWRDALRNERLFREMSRGCPGVGEGRVYSRPEIEALADGRQDTGESKVRNES